MKKNVTEKDKQKLKDKIKKVVNGLRACNDVNCVQSTQNNFIKGLTPKDQDVLGGSFDNIKNATECIANNKIDKIKNDANIQTNIDNVKSLQEALKKCSGNQICIRNIQNKINKIQKESKKLGEESKKLTNKIIDCCNDVKTITDKFFKTSKFLLKFIKENKNSYKKIKRKLKKLFKKQ
jgi:hypothetical protein